MTAPRPRSESGFMLIAVLAFVLILTIIGLSLFSMGGYEATFFGGEMSRARAYFAARSALVRGQAMLQATGSLRDVWEAPLPGGVTRLVAFQEPDMQDSLDFVDWRPSSPVTTRRVLIRATGEVNGVRRDLSMWYEPLELGAQSKNLIVNRGATTIGSPGTVGVWDDQALGTQASVVQSGADLAWRAQVSGNPHVTISDVQAPDVTGFVNAHKLSATPLSAHPSGNYDLGTDGQVTYYYSSSQTPDWSFYDTSNGARVTVHGTVVWIADHGIKFEKAVEFVKSESDPGARLVTVVKRGGALPSDYGVRFYRGIVSSPGDNNSVLPLVVVTDGRVMIGEAATSRTNVKKIAMLSDGIYLSQVDVSYGPDLDTIIRDLQQNSLYPSFSPSIAGILSPVPAGFADNTYPIN